MLKMLFFLIFFLSAIVPTASAEDLDITVIRLLGSPVDTPNAGRVQVYTDEWRDVCHNGDNWGDNDWSSTEAMVACRQLGYPGTALSRKDEYGNGDSDKAVDAFDCDGDEVNLSQCTSNNGPDNEEENCANSNDASVICTIPGYIGCYGDSDRQRVLPDKEWEDDEMTVKKCIDFCTGSTPEMRYAGVEYGTDCFCGVDGSKYDSRGKEDDDKCDKSCEGNQNEICGGSYQISIYDLTLGIACENPSLSNGMIVGQDFSFGKWVILTCNISYELVGESILQCVLGNTANESIWSGSLPICEFTGHNSCPVGWIPYGDFCYFISTDRLEYHNASADCMSRDANLTSIHTDEEQLFHAAVASIDYNQFWIGFARESAGDFTWIDGSHVTFTDWAPGEPNYDGNSACVHLKKGDIIDKWNDKSCNKVYRYICKRQKGPGLTSTAVAGTRDPQESDASLGMIVGAFLGSLFALLLIILMVVFFLFKSRHRAKEDVDKSGSTPKTRPLAFDGPYDLTIEGTQQSQHTSSNEQPAGTINYASDVQPVYGNTQTNASKEKHPVYANTIHADPAFSDIYHEVPESSTDEDYITVYADVDSNGNDSSKKGPNKAISVVYAKASNELHQNKDTDDLQEGSLYYARSDSIPNATATKQAQDSTEDDGEGWEENVTYSGFQDNDVSAEENKEVDDNDREGWEDNAIYGVDDTSCSNGTPQEWVDNDIYAGSDDES